MLTLFAALPDQRQRSARQVFGQRGQERSRHAFADIGDTHGVRPGHAHPLRQEGAQACLQFRAAFGRVFAEAGRSTAAGASASGCRRLAIAIRAAGDGGIARSGVHGSEAMSG